MTAAILLAFLADPQSMTCRVVSIHDGDTLTVLDANNAQHKIRLAGIDAPELKQPWGARARQALADRVAGRDVRIEWTTKDRYGRILGRVDLGSRWINCEMVEAGMAWQYVRFDRSAELRIAEHVARDQSRGLWADAEPIPPWEWRSPRKSQTP